MNTDFLGEFKNASFYKRISDRKNVENLAPILDLVNKAAEAGEYDIDIKEELTDTQINAMENLGFDIGTFDEDDEQYDEGFRTWIDWESAEEN